MKQFFESLRTEDWVVVWVSIPLLLLSALIPALLPNVPSTLATLDAWRNIALLFVIVLVVLYVGNRLLGRPLKGLFPSLCVVFAVSLLAQLVAKIPAVAYWGFESVFFSVLFGLLIRNVWHVPAWMKPAIQGEFFIKIGVVCLGATILFSDVMKSGIFGLVQACLVVAIVWLFAFRTARRAGVDERSAMILSSGVSICGVSACITAARVVGGDDRKLSYIVSLVLIIVVPMIYLMPWLAELILPHLFPADVAQEVAGAWIGGTIDTTSGVKLPDEVQLALKEGLISMGHAKAIAGAPAEQQLRVLKRCVKKGLSVRQAEELVRTLSETPAQPAQPEEEEYPESYSRLVELLEPCFSQEISIKRTKNGGGRIVIGFSDDKDIERFIERFSQRS